MVSQLTGKFRVRSAHLVPLYERARKLARGFRTVRFEHVPREENGEADRLANEGVEAWLAGRG
jgi:ribonuclease HI